MSNRFAIAASFFGAVILLGACQDATRSVAVAGSAGSGNDRECVGVLPPGTYDNVVVPPGATCTLNNSTILGSVKALQDARLFMLNDIVHGSIYGDKANAVQVRLNTVHGNIHIVGADDPIFFSALVFNTILPNGNIEVEKGIFPLGDWNIRFNTLQKGNIKVEENGSIFLSTVVVNNVHGNVQVFKNFGPGFKFVQVNTIRENLQCKENAPPFIGTPNVVGGHAEDQCAGPGGLSAESLNDLSSSDFPYKKAT